MTRKHIFRQFACLLKPTCFDPQDSWTEPPSSEVIAKSAAVRYRLAYFACSCSAFTRSVTSVIVPRSHTVAPVVLISPFRIPMPQRAVRSRNRTSSAAPCPVPIAALHAIAPDRGLWLRNRSKSRWLARSTWLQSAKPVHLTDQTIFPARDRAPRSPTFAIAWARRSLPATSDGLFAELRSVRSRRRATTPRGSVECLQAEFVDSGVMRFAVPKRGILQSSRSVRRTCNLTGVVKHLRVGSPR